MLFGTKQKHQDLAKAVNEEATVKGRSLSRDAYLRFTANKAAMTCMGILLIMVLFVLFGPLFSQWSNEEIDWSRMSDIRGMGAPSIENGHFFGLDELGRDLYSRVIQATGISLLVGIIGTLMALFVGTLYGITAGYVGGRTDAVMMRIIDILLAIPAALVIILFLVIAGRSFVMLFIAIGAVSWLTMARIVRAQTLALKNTEFVEAARAAGVSDVRIILRHILPNLFGVIIVYASILVPDIIFTESFISFLGLGISEPATSLGKLISEGAGQMAYGTLWQLLIPLSFYVAIMFCFFFIGDGLRDALDPKDR